MAARPTTSSAATASVPSSAMVNIVVSVEGGKTLSVRTAPTTALRHVLDAVCSQQTLAERETYALKSGAMIVDLSLTVQDARITSGSKLNLVKVYRNRKATIKATLLLEDGNGAIQDFDSTATLWDALLGFERASNWSLNLTRRTGTQPLSAKNILTIHRRLSKKGRAAGKVYMLPVVTILEQEYNSIQGLKSITLAQAGAGAQSLILRVTMRHTNHSIDQYLPEIDLSLSASLASIPASSLNPSAPPQGPSSSSDPRRLRRLLSRSAAAPTPPTSSPGLGLTHLENTPITVPSIGGRRGSVQNEYRDGHHGGPSGGANNDGNGAGAGAGAGGGEEPRQTPSQDISSAMVEATHEIRQLREQQTQEAMTDRVKRLSKSSESNADKDRFVRSMSFYQPMAPMPGQGVGGVEDTGMASIPLSRLSTTSPSQLQSEPQVVPDSVNSRDRDNLVLQIAQRVSMQLREAQQRGDSVADYHSLIAQEIVKEQKAGVLPISPADGRKRSVQEIGSEGHAQLVARTSS
ncbi:Tether containing UBX domain for GLUT4 [Gamsiella multidivaricata]|nr:Tether containing UBX domain for GLUT4 [Gamsiella multidivaricata]